MSFVSRFVLIVAYAIMQSATCVYASFPTVNEFRFGDYPPGYSIEFNQLAVDNQNQVHLIWAAEDGTPPGSGGMVSLRLYYCRFNSSGQQLVPIQNLAGDRYLVRARGAIGVNSAGKVAITAFVWDSVDGIDKLMIWFSDASGEFSQPPQLVGSDLSNWAGNVLGGVKVDERGWTYLCFENPYMVNLIGDSGYTIWLGIYNALNEKVGNSIPVESGAYRYQFCRGASIDLAEGNRVVVSWYATMDWRWYEHSCRVLPLTRSFDLNGVPIASESFVVCETPQPSCPVDSTLFPVAPGGKNPEVNCRSNGDFAVVYHSQCYFECENEFFLLRLFNSDGTPKGPNLRVNQITDCFSTPYTAKIVGDSLGNVLVAYTYTALPPDPNMSWTRKDIIGQRFGPTGVRVGTPFRFNTTQATVESGATYRMDAAANDNGLLAVTWVKSTSINGSDFQHELYLEFMDLYRAGFYDAGDADGNMQINISDVVFLIKYIFAGGYAPYTECMGDVNGDEMVNVSDVVALVNYIFAGGQIAGECIWDK